MASTPQRTNQRERISKELGLVRDKVEFLRDMILIEDNQTNEAFETLGNVLDLMREAQGYLDEDDPNAEVL